MTAVNGTITLRNQQGNVVGKQVLSFPAHSSTPVAMKTLLAAAGSQAHSGSVTLEEDRSTKGAALVAQLSMTLHSGSQPSFLEEEFGMPTMHGSPVLQGVASQTRNLPLIAITSVSEAPQTIRAICPGENKAGTSIELPAFGTAVVQACSWTALSDNSLNVSSSMLSSDASSESDHAVSLTTDSVPGSFYAFGFALNGGLNQAQLQPLDFYDPGMLPSSSITYVGVPTGATSVLSSALSAPVLTLANFSNQIRHTTVSWSDSSSGTPKVRQIADITLQAFSTQTTTLSDAVNNSVLNTFTLASDGKPGDVQAHLFNRVGTSQQRTELLAKDTKDDHNGGNHPWSIAHGDKSTLLLYNNLGKAQLFHIRISGGGNTWLDSVTLAPFETKAVSINELVSSQKPDQKKRTLPLDLTSGEVQWHTEFGSTGTGRLLVTNAATSLARSFSCERYFVMCSTYFGDQNNQDLTLTDPEMTSDSVPADLSTLSVTFCTEIIPDSCSQGSSVGSAPSQGYTVNWSYSSNVAVSSLSNTDISVYGLNFGPYTVNAYVVAGSCAAGGGGGGNVAINTVKLIANAKKDLPAKCDQKFQAAIPGYTNAAFFKSLSSATILQYPNVGPTDHPDSGSDSDTLTDVPGAPIRLLPNFYGIADAHYREADIVHEGIHHFTLWIDATIFSKLAPYGLTNPTKTTSDITTWIEGGCLP